MSNHWKQRPEGGGRFALWLIRGIARHAGRSVGRALLYPITLYFLLVRGPSPSSVTEAVWPGNNGCTNFTCGKRAGARAPCTASTACSTWSSTTTPGTTGRPGKCPGREG